MADGAALLLLGTEAAAAEAGLRPRGRILASAVCAVDPVVMLTAGQQATEMAIARAGLSPEEIDVFEFAEAFAALCLRFRRDLQAGPDRMNPNGGTIAMGHAFGATGAIMVGGALSELERRGGRFGVAAVSGAAGLGVAVVVERLSADPWSRFRVADIWRSSWTGVLGSGHVLQHVGEFTLNLGCGPDRECQQRPRGNLGETRLVQQASNPVMCKARPGWPAGCSRAGEQFTVTMWRWAASACVASAIRAAPAVPAPLR
jgi:hypothetical protein